MQTNKETKGLNPAKIVAVIEFHSGGKEMLGSCGVEGMFDIFRTHDN